MILSVLQSQFKHNITVIGESQKFLPWCHDDILVTEPVPLPPFRATEGVKAVRDFVITLEDSGKWEREFLSSLWAIENAFLRLQVKQMRPTKLKGYFQEWTSVKNNEQANSISKEDNSCKKFSFLYGKIMAVIHANFAVVKRKRKKISFRNCKVSTPQFTHDFHILIASSSSFH